MYKRVFIKRKIDKLFAMVFDREDERLEERARNGLMRFWGFFEKFQISRYFCSFQGSFVKFKYSCVYSTSFSLA